MSDQKSSRLTLKQPCSSRRHPTAKPGFTGRWSHPHAGHSAFRPSRVRIGRARDL